MPATTRDAGADLSPAAEDVPHVTVGPGAQGPWHDGRLVGAAASPAVVTADGAVQSIVAIPTADHTLARFSWVAWTAAGARIAVQIDAPAMAPGAALGLLARADGWTAVWSGVVGDAGATEHALDINPRGFAGPARAASATEVEAARWALDAMNRRSRERLDLLPQDAARDGVRATAQARGGRAAVLLDGAEVLRGDDLAGYAQAMSVASRGDTRWLALSRGRCREARVELWAVRAGASTLRASFPIGVEVGVRWLRVEPGARGVAVSWYQELIPLRIPCARGDGGATTSNHGVRVAAVLE